MVHGDVEEPLNLPGVQVHRQHAVDSRRHEEIRHQLGGDGHAGAVLAVLPGVAEERKHGGDAVRRWRGARRPP